MDEKKPAPKPESPLVWFRRRVIARMPASQKAQAAQAGKTHRVVGF